jgi:hypothetical protein
MESETRESEISTFGLDDIEIQKSDSNFIEIFLYDEEQNAYNIFTVEEDRVLKIEYRKQVLEPEIFRKYITKRLNLANSIIKITINKTVMILGNHI